MNFDVYEIASCLIYVLLWCFILAALVMLCKDGIVEIIRSIKKRIEEWKHAHGIYKYVKCAHCGDLVADCYGEWIFVDPAKYPQFAKYNADYCPGCVSIKLDELMEEAIRLGMPEEEIHRMLARPTDMYKEE